MGFSFICTLCNNYCSFNGRDRGWSWSMSDEFDFGIFTISNCNSYNCGPFTRRFGHFGLWNCLLATRSKPQFKIVSPKLAPISHFDFDQNFVSKPFFLFICKIYVCSQNFDIYRTSRFFPIISILSYNFDFVLKFRFCPKISRSAEHVDFLSKFPF